MSRIQLQLYRQSQRSFIVTSRFNTKTWQENETFRKTHPNIKCIYGAPDPIKRDIPIDTSLFVLEMNNDTNKIVGIGKIENRPSRTNYRIYSDGNYNRFKYVGNQHISREEMTEEEDEIMQVFDILCFKGNRHMKRGQGLKAFPIETLFKCSRRMDLVQFVATMFEKRE
jgi:hypothetical protein